MKLSDYGPCLQTKDRRCFWKNRPYPEENADSLNRLAHNSEIIPKFATTINRIYLT